MGRRRRGPWQRKGTGPWYTTEPRTKKLVRLTDADESYETALQRYHEYHLRKSGGSGPLTVTHVLDQFLEWVQQNRSKRTYDWYRAFLGRFRLYVGDSLLLANLAPHHVTDWLLADYRDSTNNTRRGAIRTVQRAMNWAVRDGRISQNPLRGIEKPRQQSREEVVTPQQFEQMLTVFDKKDDVCFRDYLTFLWETGCRAQEIRLIEAHHFDGQKIILERINSKGERYNRVIYLSDKALEINQRLIEQYPEGVLFRNSNHKPWTRSAVRNRFRTIKKRLGIDQLNATMLRHTWATDVLTRRVLDTTTASILMGHRDPSTLARNYQHLTQNHDFLAEAARLARSGESQSS